MSGRRPHRSYSLTAAFTAAVTTVLALTAAACSSSSSDSRRASAGEQTATAVQGEAARGETVPTAGGPFWIDPESDAARQVRQWEKEGRADDAKALRRISERAVAEWPAGDDPVPEISRAVRGAAADKRTAVFVAYNIPHRDCGLYSAGGAHDAAYYREWIDAFADAIGDAPAIVILEPDAVPHLADGCTPAQHHAERYELLAHAISRLKRQPKTKVYLDAGNPAWISDPARLAEPLKRAGIEAADGFSLNVSNFQTNDTVKTFGTRLSGLLGDAHFTVDTSRNGVGPLSGDRDEAWCNPPGRALGTPPTTNTGNELLDAYLWIKRPGESDGPCRGGPTAGTWWPDYALGLARKARA
ncbi:MULTISPECIES: glycoside hydrolase family 6 protein [unclassified Streptomyces]|uniref:glycoside hydrolase family 6 protein n=1 Tax=unclassified Streptomyces TaxID=2593676 RepID=UPI00081E3CFC|nr:MULTISPECIES: glycoside hydrolase family 6 protein [unclassified Streptomyces]MYZ37708.1 endoglucanase [Streptomyces sp. SID4917]SCF93435.1 endoglucanase [Streptomyces sp. MnatMP-M17]